MTFLNLGTFIKIRVTDIMECLCLNMVGTVGTAGFGKKQMNLGVVDIEL